MDTEKRRIIVSVSIFFGLLIFLSACVAAETATIEPFPSFTPVTSFTHTWTPNLPQPPLPPTSTPSCLANLTFMEERFGQVQNHISSTDKAKKILGFSAKTSFEEGLRKTIQWYKDNRHLWEKQMAMRKVPVKAKDGKIVWY